MGFHSRIYEILDGAFCIFPVYIWVWSTPNNDSTIKTSQIGAFTLFFPKKFWRVLEKIGKNQRGHIFSTGSHVKKGKFVLFSSFVQLSIPDYKNVICLLVLPGWTILG